jgi:hypothetical protein
MPEGGSSKNYNELLKKMDYTVSEARRKIIEAGESMTPWKVFRMRC